MGGNPITNGRLAAIYVRTSSEHQAEKASPEEQEADCRKLAEERGLTVVKVYRDIERYRVKTRLVDPSGTRADRPGLVAMLRDAAQGQFDTIIAWREDRLYRGMRAMLSVLEMIQEHEIDVLLAKETFDLKMAPLKAWVAGMELDGIKERMTMGVKARLRAGKANTGQDRYGYKRNGEVIEVVEEEAFWVRQLFDWYIQGTPIPEMRRRLIAANAPQKGSSVPRKIHWAHSSIQGILQAGEAYATGIKIQRRCGEKFEIRVPPIIDMATYQKSLQVREANKKHPVHNQKRDYLAGGLIYCPCDRKWMARTSTYAPLRKNSRGELIPRNNPQLYGVYHCPEHHTERIHPDCPRTIGSGKMDKILWEKVCTAIDDPDVLISRAVQHVDELRQQAETVSADKERLQGQLDALIMERQWVITQARKGKITEEDMDCQIAALTLQESDLKQQMATLGSTERLAMLDNWEEVAREYFKDLKAALAGLNADPQTEEDRRKQFELKRQTVKTLVQKVLIGKDRQIQVVIRLDVLAMLQAYAAGSAKIQMDEICIRRLLALLDHPPGSCA
jgi:DNA invertase Pin-like site-specific DNA recombinase